MIKEFSDAFSDAFFRTIAAHPGRFPDNFMNRTRPDAGTRSPLPSSSTERPSNFGGQGRPLSSLPVKVQEDIKARGKHLPDEETGEQPRFIGVMMTCPTVVNGETIYTDNDDHLHWMRLPSQGKSKHTTKPNMFADPTPGHALPTPFDMPKSPDRDELGRAHRETILAAEAVANDPKTSQSTKGDMLYYIATINRIYENSRKHPKEVHRPPNPFEPDRMPRNRDPSQALNEGPPEWERKRSSSTESNYPEPALLSLYHVQDMILRKVKHVREEFRRDLNITKARLESQIVQIEQNDNNKVMKLEIRLKISEQEKKEYKEEILKLRAKVKMLEKDE
jgi:hypothetical protein